MCLALGCASAAGPEDGAPFASDRDKSAQGKDASTPSATTEVRAQDGGVARGQATLDAAVQRDSGKPGAPDGGRADATSAGSDTSAEAGAPLRDAGASAQGAASGCGAGAFCEDFERASAGETLAAGWSSVAPMCSGTGRVAIDGAVAHGGKQSVRVSSTGGFCNHVFAQPMVDLAPFGDALWLRMWVRFEQPLSAEHVTFFTLRDQVSGKDLRLGGQSNILMWNREAGDATLPELSPSGIAKSVPMNAGSWRCIEFELKGTSGKFTTYVDGKLVEALVVDEAPTMDVDGQWLRGAGGKWTAKVSEPRFGWESYGGPPNTVWYDDIMISSERPGC